MVQASPSSVYKVVPIFATGTFCLVATFVEQQTICNGISKPMFTVVSFNLSAFGCCTQVKTSPTTIPSNPPFTDWKELSPSTSKPKSVSSSLSSSGDQVVFINCFNQL